MNSLLQVLDDWLEVWPIVIPLIIILIYRPKEPQIRPLIIYIYIAFVLNLAATLVIAFFYSLPLSLRNNTYLYNIHAVVRVMFFSWYIFSIRWQNKMNVLVSILTAFLIFTVIHFWRFFSLMEFSNILHSLEAVLLIALCALFFLNIINDDSEKDWMSEPSLLICIGIGIFETVALFIYLFFYELSNKDHDFGKITMTIRKLSYLILCIMIGIAMLKTMRSYNKRKQYTPAISGK